MRNVRRRTFVSGRILSVQEQRFRLLSQAGQAYLFTMAASASVDGAMLCSLRDTQAQVTVSYSGEPNLAGCVAHKVQVGA